MRELPSLAHAHGVFSQKCASKVVAANHIRTSFAQGFCSGRGSCFNPDLVPPTSMQCPLCGWVAVDIESLLHHIPRMGAPIPWEPNARVDPQGSGSK